MIDFPRTVIGFAAFSGTGKTTLLRQVIAQLRGRGLRVAVIKHAHHTFDIDKPGKDSYELRKAGATQTLVASRERWALITEVEPPDEPQLPALLEQLDPETVDLVLVEGFKHAPIPKIELHRKQLRKPLLFLTDTNVIAIACDDLPVAEAKRLPILDIDRPGEIADFIIQRLHDRALRRSAADER